MDAGITFILDNGTQIHTYQDLNLKQLADITISSPVPKRHLITDVMGMDGQLDVTSKFGPVRFENRTITAGFEGQDQNYDEWCEVCGKVANALHGRHAQIILDVDPDWYWDGFITVAPKKEAIAYSYMEIGMDVCPYKLHRNEYLKTVAISDIATVKLVNDRMPASVVIVADTDLVVVTNGNSYELIAGRNEPDFELSEGENVLEFTGEGNVEISWRGGSL